MLRKLSDKILNIRTDFQALFFRNEYGSLIGRSGKGMLTLVVILLLTLLALGTAIGGLEYLDVRMNNPFTNWVNVPITAAYEKKIPIVRDSFAVENVRNRYKLNNISDYVAYGELFFDAESGQRYFYKGRTVTPDDDLIKKVLDSGSGNVVSGFAFDRPEDEIENMCGVIVTRRMLKELHYDNPTAQRKIPIAVDSFTVWFDIISVVEELPDLSDFVSMPRLYNMMAFSFDRTGFMDVSGDRNQLYFLSENGDTKALTEKMKAAFSDFPRVNKLKQSEIVLNDNQKHYLYQIIFNDFFKADATVTLQQRVGNALDKADAYQPYADWRCTERMTTIDRPYHLAFNFTELDRVRPFKKYMQQEFDMEISMAQIESKENFALVSRLTFFISVILFLFGTASIVFFVDSLLKTHLQKVKTNLGTFKAFGLNNKLLINTYLKIIMTFLGAATLIAFGLALIVAGAEELWNKESTFNLLNEWVALAIVLLFLISYFKSRHTIGKILSHTPGDLIYNRV